MTAPRPKAGDVTALRNFARCTLLIFAHFLLVYFYDQFNGVIVLKLLFDVQSYLSWFSNPTGLYRPAGFHYILVGMEGVEPSRLAAHDPKSCLSASSSTSPVCVLTGGRNYTVGNARIGNFLRCIFQEPAMWMTLVFLPKFGVTFAE